jgi:hypothetical protein
MENSPIPIKHLNMNKKEYILCAAICDSNEKDKKD